MTKGRKQRADLKTEYPNYSCLHEVTFIKLPFECSNSKLGHQQNIIKQLLEIHSSKFTLLLFQHNFLTVKVENQELYQECPHEIQEKIRNCSKSGIIRKIRKCLTDCVDNRNKNTMTLRFV